MQHEEWSAQPTGRGDYAGEAWRRRESIIRRKVTIVGCNSQPSQHGVVAQMVERHSSKVNVASSILVYPSTVGSLPTMMVSQGGSAQR